jgi:hypothetical protein
MKKLLPLVFFALIFSFSSCKKNDACEAFSCQNGGTVTTSSNNVCSCNCPNGYSGEHCETSVPSCQLNHTGQITVYNGYASNYSVTINGVFKGNVGGYSSIGPFEYTSNITVSVHTHQLDGYVFTPSDWYSTPTVIECYNVTTTPQ